jgi:hypothetical protein
MPNNLAIGDDLTAILADMASETTEIEQTLSGLGITPDT